MKVQLLGTGAADGWPQPFCRCPSCEQARINGQVRCRSGVLVDGTLLIDPSPDAASACARAGVTLSDVTCVLIGHGHPDHCDPALFLARGWVLPDAPLAIHGPPSALEIIRPWLNPEVLAAGTIALIEAVVDVTVDLPSGHRARALPAEHGLGNHGQPRSDPRGPEPDAVLWEITAPSGSRMLHAADTGPIPDSTVNLIKPLDLLLLEETFGTVTDHGTAHLDLNTFPVELARLRSTGAVHAGTQVVATHLSHYNPPEPELADMLRGWGARPGRDLEVIDLGSASPTQIVTSPRRTLITGGARSGKSRAAERLVAAHSEVHYVATAAPREQDAEWDERVDRHRSRRPGHWITHETADITSVIESTGPDAAVLVDCITLWVARLVDDSDAWDEPVAARASVLAHTDRLVSALRAATCRVVIVSNEVGSGIVPEARGVRMYQDLVGEVNAAVSGGCDTTLLAVAGRVTTIGPAR